GDLIRLGESVIEVLWPPQPGGAVPAAGPNAASVVVMVRHGGFEALLTGDAEFGESKLPPPGTVELLKVAHHGSEDPGLAAALARLQPAVAAISAGAGNPF